MRTVFRGGAAHNDRFRRVSGPHVMPAIVSLGPRFLQFVAIPWAWTSCTVTLML
jgi:hypothetical protein